MTSPLSDAEAVRLSRMLSKTLRHDPGRVGVTLDAGGWVAIDDLRAALASKGTVVSREALEAVVQHNDKQRFAIDGDRIRASQGHSITVDLGLQPVPPPPLLFHGTGSGSVASILESGIDSGSRLHVHLSPDTSTARVVDARHGRAVVLTVMAAAMDAEGFTFWRSANGVWLTDSVPARFVRQ